MASHLAERHGLIVIIALGESIVAVGVGAEGLGPRRGLIVAALLGMVVAGGMWWAYFDFVAWSPRAAARRRRPTSGAASPATRSPTCTCRW